MTPVGAWFITFLNSLGNRQSGRRRDVIYHVPSQRRVHCATYLFLGYCLSVINHAPSIYANKINKKAVLATNTADICRQVVVQCRKTLNFGITRKMLIIRTVDFFDTKKRRSSFKNRRFLRLKARNETVFCSRRLPKAQRYAMQTWQIIAFDFLFRQKTRIWFFFTIR